MDYMIKELKELEKLKELRQYGLSATLLEQDPLTLTAQAECPRARS